MKRSIILCGVMLLAACATSGTLPTASPATALVNVDKAIIVADAGYHLAAQSAAVIVRSGAPPATRAAIDRANDRAAAALHLAYQVRTSFAVAAAVAAIADFTRLVGSK